MSRKKNPGPSRSNRRTEKTFTQHGAEILEERALLSATSAVAAAAATGFEPIGGTGNNVANPTWGTAGVDLLRISSPQFANGVNSPSLPQDPSARLISNLVNNQADPANPSQDLNTVNQRSLSDFGYAFGQFMDHDLDLTQGNGAPNNIAVPQGDPIGGPNDTPLDFNRSATDPATGTGPGNPLQNPNSVTAYFDLSQVYGSDQATADALRTMSGGQMKTSPGGLPPLNNSTYFTSAQLAAINASVGGMADGGPLPVSQMFVTGDTRGNENVELTALQTLFLDNHNRIAAQLQKQNPTWTDEQLYQEARKINIAQYQSIIYNEWIPAVLGTNALPAYKGYNPNVNPGISDEFSTVAFRFGHSLLSGEIGRAGNNGQPVADNVPLSQDFFDPTILNGQGQPTTTDPMTGLTTTDIGAILKADADGVSQETDVMAINDVRNLLFNEVVPNVGFGQDLIALDIQRARDQGIGSYNQLRQAFGLPAVTSFSQITKNVQVQQALEKAYGSVNNIEPFEGGLAEDHVAGSDVGPLFQAIMVNQFTRLRDGDRFFYLNQHFTPSEQSLINQGNTLAKVIEANTNITNLQSDVFLFQSSIGGTVSYSAAHLLPRGIGIPGVTVELEDSSGNVLATTTTDRHGNYSFNQLSGPGADAAGQSGVSETGSYNVVLSLPSFLQQTTSNPSSIAITRGGQNVTGVNFGVTLDLSKLTAAANSPQLQAAVSQLSGGAKQGLSTASSVSPSSTSSTQTPSADTQAATTTSPAANTLTADEFIAFLESARSGAGVGVGVGGGTADSGNQSTGSSPPTSTGTLDAAFTPDEIAKIIDLLR